MCVCVCVCVCVCDNDNVLFCVKLMRMRLGCTQLLHVFITVTCMYDHDHIVLPYLIAMYVLYTACFLIHFAAFYVTTPKFTGNGTSPVGQVQ